MDRGVDVLSVSALTLFRGNKWLSQLLPTFRFGHQI